MRSLLLTLLLSLFLALPGFAAELHLSVAASMTDAVKELISTYHEQAPEVAILPNFASSGSLAKQIAQGAPADIFISANPKWMKYLVAEKRVAADHVCTFAFNSLVFVGKQNPAVTGLDSIVGLQRVAIGSPKSVPAGQYAEQALKAGGVYDKVQGRLIMAKDVRQALMYADRGETDGAFVYKTDALLAKDAVILFEVPQALYNEVTYPMGLTIEGLQRPEALAFVEFLKTDQASTILKKYGFVVR